MTQFNTTELDFDKIKTNLKEYFKRSDSEFKDWDFEGSGLSFFLDVLGYNTHYNAILAHTSMSETFLDSAQVRGNVVSRAKYLGYTPNSMNAAVAEISLVVNRSETSIVETFSLPKGTTFTSSIDGTDYQFILIADSEDAVWDPVAETFTFESLYISQGVYKSNSYFVDNSYEQNFVITDQQVDTDHMDVKVFTNPNSDDYDLYDLFTQFDSTINDESLIYFLEENPFGNYEVRFGNNIFGAAPKATSKVVIEYLKTEGPEGNGAYEFTFSDFPTGYVPVDIDETSMVITTVSNSAGGGDKEDIVSIKANAPLTYIAQERAVTAVDYHSLLSREFSYVDAINVWGGEDNIPVDLGYVYICVKPSGNESLTQAEEDEIAGYILTNKGVLGIQPKFVDPDFTYLFFDITFRYDTARTTKTITGMINGMKTQITLYNDTILKDFNSIFRHSNFVTNLDESDRGILNSIVKVKEYKKVSLADQDESDSPKSNHILNVNFEHALAGLDEQNDSIVTSDTFVTINSPSETVMFKDYLTADSPEIRTIGIYDNDTGALLKADAGTVDLNTGVVQVDLFGFEPADESQYINVYSAPESNDVVSERDNILQIDLDKTSIIGQAD